jgi:Domain of unknown function (DUF4465)
MKRWMILALILTMSPTAKADVVSTFEDLGLPANSFNNNLGTNGFFNSGGNSFNNSFDPTFGTWSGWSISSQTNISNPGGSIPDFNFEYTAITGIGGNGSQTYAVANTFGDTADPFHPASSIVNLAAGASPISIQITNTAYDYYSMLYGDSFAHQFGAGDFLLLTIAGYSLANGGGSKVGEVDFYLANFLGSDPSLYYIVNTWQTVDLSSLMGAQSLVFGLESSDNDPMFGINTPAEFAADNLIASTAVPESSGFLLCLTGIGIGGGVLIARRSKGQSAQP